VQAAMTMPGMSAIADRAWQRACGFPASVFSVAFGF